MAPPARKKPSPVKTGKLKPRGRVATPAGVMAEIEEAETRPETRTAALAKVAVEAPKDIGDALREMEAIQASRRRNPATERTYAQMRSELLPRITAPMVFIGPDNERWLAFVVTPDLLQVDVEGLIEAEWEGDLRYETLEIVAPRSIDLTALRREVAAGRISSEVLARANARYVPGTSYVRSVPLDQAWLRKPFEDLK